MVSWALPTVSSTTIDISNGANAYNLLGQVYTNSIFGRVNEIVGIAPCVIATMFCMGIFYFNANRIKKSGLKVFTKGSMIILSLIWFELWGFLVFFSQMVTAIVGLQEYSNYSPFSNIYNALTYLFIGLILGGLSTWAIFYLLSNVKQQSMYELFRWAIIVISATFASLILMQVVLKHILQRERFRFIYAFSQVQSVTDGTTIWTGTEYSNITYGGFVHWYEIPVAQRGYNSEDITMSCPSGHTTMAALGSLSLILLPMTVRAYNTKKIRAWCFSLAIIGTVVVGLGRMVAGAHYLSDVTFGTLIASGFLTIFYLICTFGSKYLNTATGLATYYKLKQQINK